MDIEERVKLIEDTGIIAIVRLKSPDQLMQVARAIAAGGVKVVEFTMTTPRAIAIIEQCAREFQGEILLGAGTVLDPETARTAILAGAEFIVSPTFDPAVVEMCRRYSVVSIPGTLTPSEILKAWQAGATLVKVFPAEIGGPPYIKALRAPLPQIKMVPTGGVTVENTGAYISVGASAVAVGGNLVGEAEIAEGRFEQLTEKAGRFIQAVRDARAGPSRGSRA